MATKKIKIKTIKSDGITTKILPIKVVKNAEEYARYASLHGDGSVSKLLKDAYISGFWAGRDSK